MENKKKTYEAPRLTVVTFKTERGYATSGGVQSVWVGAWIGVGEANIDGMQDYNVLSNATW